MKVVNRAYKKVKITPYDVTARDIIGRSVEKDALGDIDNIARDLIENQASYAERIDRERHEYFYNLGSSGEAAADYIISRLVKKKKKKAKLESENTESSSEETSTDSASSESITVGAND